MKLQNYESGVIAVDPVIFTIKNARLYVYLNLREKEPYKSFMELPGGLLLPNETAEKTLNRKLKNILGAKGVYFEQFYTFTKPTRDPRKRTVSIGFMALTPSNKVLNSDNFYDFNRLPKLAFDHKEIINTAYRYLKQHLNNQFARQFLPLYFPLNDLQMVYEVIRQEKLDNRNFRKKILDSGLIEKIKEIQENVPHRPASLYRFVEK